MKKTLKHSLVVMAMLGAITGYANLEPDFPSTINNKTTIIRLDKVREGQRLLIKSKTGTILYNESISQNGVYRKNFDLTSLPDGDYFFEHDMDMVIQIIPFNVHSNSVEFIKANEIKIFKPVVRSKDHQLLFSKLSLDLQPMTLEIYYENPYSQNSEKIYSERIEKTKVIERIYTLDIEKSGNYKIITKSEGRVFTQTLTI